MLSSKGGTDYQRGGGGEYENGSQLRVSARFFVLVVLGGWRGCRGGAPGGSARVPGERPGQLGSEEQLGSMKSTFLNAFLAFLTF